MCEICPLTTDTLTYTGDTGDDSFNGSAGVIDGMTLAGNAGDDALTLTLSLAGDDDSAFVATGIEAMTIRTSGGTAGDGNDVDVEMGDVSDVETLVLRRLNDDISFENLQDLATVITLSNTATAADVTVDYDASIVTGTADVGNITVSTSTGGGDLVINGVETINVTATGDDNDLNVDGDDLATVNVLGTGDINMDVDASVTTLDASANTGGVTINATAAADVIFTGGTGADTFAFAAAEYDEDDTVDGGDGTDTLNITAFATVAGESYSSDNVEVLRLESAGVTVEVDQFSGYEDFTTVRVDASATSLVLSDVDMDSTVLVTNNAAGTDITQTSLAVTFASDTGTSDSATITLTGDGDDTTVDLTVTTLNVDEIETVNIVANATSDGSIAVSTVTANEIDLLNISGAADIAIGGTTALTVVEVNASTATGDVSLTLGAAASDLTSGSGNDTFAFGVNLGTTDTVDGGTGTDSLTATLAAGTAAATISNVESATLEFGTASSTFSGANASTALTSIVVDEASDEAVSLTNLKSVVASVRIGSAQAGGNAIAISYKSGSSSAHAVVIGDNDEAAAVAEGALTISGNAGALTITSDAFTGNLVTAITANAATSLTLVTEEDLEVDVGALSATAATSVTMTSDGGVLLVDGAQTLTAATAITIDAADGNITLTGAMTATAATSLTVTATDDFLQTGNFVSDADVTAVSLTASGISSSIRYDGILDVDHVRAINLTAVDGGTVTVDDIEMLGLDNDAATDIDTSLTISATGTDSADDGSTVTVSAINVAAATTLDAVTITSDADGTVNLTTGATSLTITDIDASESLGDFTLDASTLAAATSVSTGSGTNDLTTDNGFADTITLIDSAGTDTISIVADNGGTSAADEVTNFEAGASGDVLSLTLAGLDGTGADPVNGAGTDVSSTLAVNIQTDANGALTLAAATNIILLTNTFADVAAVVTALTNNVITAGVSDIDDNDNLLVVWTDGASSYLSRIQINDAGFDASAGADTIAAYDQAENLVELVGVTVSELTAANFAFV